ncbi:hypothetical protein Pelo_19883 [Pelomyxa schiedti]|nr:hypothetical protein Pelo_19883 [Pelomyxa schiedti]
MVRWQMLINDFGAVIEYRPGKQAGDADSLSRRPGLVAAAVCVDGEPVQWKAEQDKDEICRAIRSWISEGQDLPVELRRKGLYQRNFMVEDGIVYYIELDRRRHQAIKADTCQQSIHS